MGLLSFIPYKGGLFYRTTRTKELGNTTCPPTEREVSLRSGGACAQRFLSPETELGWLEDKHGGRKLPTMDAGTRGWCHCPGSVGTQYCLPSEKRLGSQERSHSSPRGACDPAREARQKLRILPGWLIWGDIYNWVLLISTLAVQIFLEAYILCKNNT